MLNTVQKIQFLWTKHHSGKSILALCLRLCYIRQEVKKLNSS